MTAFIMLEEFGVILFDFFRVIFQHAPQDDVAHFYVLDIFICILLFES